MNLGTIAAYARTHSTCAVLFAHKSDAASFGVAAQFIGYWENWELAKTNSVGIAQKGKPASKKDDKR